MRGAEFCSSTEEQAFSVCAIDIGKASYRLTFVKAHLFQVCTLDALDHLFLYVV